MSGQLDAPDGATVVFVDVLALEREGALHAEMARIRAKNAEGGRVTDAERARYRAHWLGLALRRSSCSRPRLSRDVDRQLALRAALLAELEHEHARRAVDAAFGPDDTPLEEAGTAMR